MVGQPRASGRGTVAVCFQQILSAPPRPYKVILTFGKPCEWHYPQSLPPRFVVEYPPDWNSAIEGNHMGLPLP